MNALEVSAVELVSIAHEVGCQYVCVFTHVPEPDMPFGGVTPEMVPEMQARMAATGVPVMNIEIFPLTEGGTTDDVVALPTELFGYAQICDGADLEPSSEYMTEVFERMLPGEGVFPLTAFLDAVPAATPVEVEVPSLIGEQNGVPPLERARRAAKAAREVLDRAQPTR